MQSTPKLNRLVKVEETEQLKTEGWRTVEGAIEVNGKIAMVRDMTAKEIEAREIAVQKNKQIAALKKQQQEIESRIAEVQVRDLMVNKGLITDSTPSNLDELLITSQLLKDTANGEVTAFASVTSAAFQSAVLEVPTDLVQEWTVGTAYKKGQIVNYKGVKYLLMNNATAQAHQPPDMPNGVMLSVYKPYRDSNRYEWFYGEYCPKGYERSYQGVWYRVIQADAGANIYSPNQVPSVWEAI